MRAIDPDVASLLGKRLKRTIVEKEGFMHIYGGGELYDCRICAFFIVQILIV